MKPFVALSLGWGVQSFTLAAYDYVDCCSFLATIGDCKRHVHRILHQIHTRESGGEGTWK